MATQSAMVWISLWAQTGIVRKVANGRVRKPGRHLSASYDLLNSGSKTPGFVIAGERHGARLTGAMTVLAMRLKDWKNVLVKGRPGCCQGDS